MIIKPSGATTHFQVQVNVSLGKEKQKEIGFLALIILVTQLIAPLHCCNNDLTYYGGKVLAMLPNKMIFLPLFILGGSGSSFFSDQDVFLNKNNSTKK